MNDFFGYRTKRSMTSQNAWLFANRYSSDLIFKFSLACISLQILLIIVSGLLVALITAVSFWVVILLGTILRTEQLLKRKLSSQKFEEQ